ncbi:MAG: hypothetical protein LBG57_01280 [Treponema sp.]|jgi:hypothetical protein|nr:hypothetical protein [Treponema sp.]
MILYALALGFEGNMNTVYFASAGAWLSAMMEPGFGAGLKAGYNFYGIGTLEMAALGRCYLISFAQSRLFFQIELGTDLIFSEGKTYPVLLLLRAILGAGNLSKIIGEDCI